MTDASRRRRRLRSSVTRLNPHRISAYEAVFYTIGLLFAAAVAFGWFDLMIPWGS